METRKTICGIDCSPCAMKDKCCGCAETGGRPFHGSCMLAECCQEKGYACCGACPDQPCALKEQAIAAFNALGIADMEPVTTVYALLGSYINLAYTLPSGQKTQFWRDDRIYLGTQLPKKNSDRCYGLTIDETYLLVCEYDEGGTDAEIVLLKRR